MTEAAADKPEEPDKGDPVIEHFVELRKYIEHSHEGLSKRLEQVEVGQKLLGRKVDGGFDRLDRKFDGLDGKVDGLDRKVDGLDRRVGGLESKVDGLDRRVGGLELKIDAGFDRLARKIDALAPRRRPSAPPRRRKP